MWFFLNALCNKVLDTELLDKLEEDHIINMCLLEQVFLRIFLTYPLTVHLIAQVRLRGPAYLCWMYPFKRNLSGLKAYVRNRYRPEGCIAECYIVEEAL